MRAVTFDRYGPPGVLQLTDVERPVPKDDEVHVRVHATTATRSDCGLRSAEYFVGRFFTGISLLSKRAKLGIVRYTKPGILTLAELVEAGEYRPVIDRTYALEEVVDAHRYVETHEKTGKSS